MSHSLQLNPEEGYEVDVEETARRSKRLTEKTRVDYKTMSEGEKLPNRGTGPVADFMEKNGIPKSDANIQLLRTETNNTNVEFWRPSKLSDKNPTLTKTQGDTGSHLYMIIFFFNSLIS